MKIKKLKTGVTVIQARVGNKIVITTVEPKKQYNNNQKQTK